MPLKIMAMALSWQKYTAIHFNRCFDTVGSILSLDIAAPNQSLSDVVSSPQRAYLAVRSAYVHIPFCRRRCFYCDFPISVLGDRLRGENSGTVQHYLDVLAAEILATPIAGDRLDTVFFGGGTPSLLSPAQIESILSLLERRFTLAPDAEISIEMDPGTFDLAQLQGYRTAGINRVSLGVQAFCDQALAACGRTHRLVDIELAIALMHQVAIPSWSLDLISGLPYQTLATWEAGLTAAIAAQPHHLSIYDLTIEPQTVFARRYHPGATPLPSDIQTADMYRLAQQKLTTNGYYHYEISNYARTGHQCHHNLTYWHNHPHYGFGMGATSYSGGQRFGRPRTLREYTQWVKTFIKEKGQLAIPAATPGEQFLDHLLVGLRLATGVNGEALTQLPDSPLANHQIWQRLVHCLTPHIERGWVVISPALTPLVDLASSPLPASLNIRLSDPEGFLFSNQVLIDLFSEFSDLYTVDEPGTTME